VITFTLSLLKWNFGVNLNQKGIAVNWYTAVIKNYAGFTGRARRTEYWMFTLISVIISIVLDVISYALKMGTLLGGLYGLAVLIPTLAVGVRRLHDTDRSGWWLLIGLIPLVGAIILIVFFATEGNRGENQHGPDPKAAAPVA
jgi:uncharacterized membrane protein YhaH (DUF805 family)